jgi:photosystem II stability/assembly factor-like uncharacterized protein
MSHSRLQVRSHVLAIIVGGWVLLSLNGCSDFLTGSDGGSWEIQRSGTTAQLQGVWGSSPSDVFLVGSQGTILHYNGDKWSPMNSGTTEHLTAVCGRSADDVYAVGTHGIFLHYDGSRWTTMPPPGTWALYDVWTAPDCAVYATGVLGAWMFSGQSWVDLGGPSEAWAVVGFRGRLHSALYEAEPFHLFASDGRDLYLYHNGKWARGRDVVGSTVYDVWGFSAGELFVVCLNGGIFQNLDGSFSEAARPTTRAMRGVHGRALDDVYAVGSVGTIAHFDGSEWKTMDTPTEKALMSVWVSPDGHAFAVGYQGIILHRAP